MKIITHSPSAFGLWDRETDQKSSTMVGSVLLQLQLSQWYLWDLTQLKWGLLEKPRHTSPAASATNPTPQKQNKTPSSIIFKGFRRLEGINKDNRNYERQIKYKSSRQKKHKYSAVMDTSPIDARDLKVIEQLDHLVPVRIINVRVSHLNTATKKQYNKDSHCYISDQ